MADGTAGAAAAPSFDGIIKQWPKEQALTISIIPTDKKEFLRYMTCELFKNQNITEPRKQANNALDYAKSLYSVLSSNGLMD